MVREWRTYAAGTVVRRANRPRSPAMRMGLRRIRSTHTPAGSVNRMNGRNAIVPRAATSNGVDSSTITATSGRASCPTCEPNWLIVSADQSLRKSPWRQSPPVGHMRTAGHYFARLALAAVEPILVEATRGDVVEARHQVHAVAISGGKIIESCRD